MKKAVIFISLIFFFSSGVLFSQELGINIGLSSNNLFRSQNNVNSMGGNIGSSAGFRFDGLFSAQGSLGYSVEAFAGQYSFSYFDVPNTFREFRISESNLFIPLNLTMRLRFADPSQWITYGIGPYFSLLIKQEGFSTQDNQPFVQNSAGFANRINLGLSGEAKYFRMLSQGSGISFGVQFRADLMNPLYEKNNVLLAPANSLGFVAGYFRKF